MVYCFFCGKAGLVVVKGEAGYYVARRCRCGNVHVQLSSESQDAKRALQLFFIYRDLKRFLS